MKINQLNLKSFKGIKDRKFNFDKINVISGPNGSGKTSIFEALELLLINNLEQRMEHYIHWGSKGFVVEADLDLDITKAKYEIEYSGSTKRHLKTSNDEYFQSDAVRYLQAIINPNLALYSSISRQGESYSILKETPANRLNKFKSIFSIDVLSKIAEAIKSDIKTHKETIKSLEKDIEYLQNKKYEFFPDLEIGNIKETEKQFKIQNKEKQIFEKNQESVKQYNEKLKTWENVQDKIEILVEAVAYSKVEIKDLTSKLKEVNNELIQQQRVKLEEEIEKKNKYDKARETFFEYDNKKAEIEKAVNKLQYPDVIEVPIDPGITDEKLEKTKNYLLELKYEIEKEENKLKLAKQGRCPTCNQDYKIESIEDLEHDIGDLRVRKGELEDSFYSAQQNFFKYKEKQKEHQEYLLRQDAIQKQFDFYQSQLQSLIKVEKPEREAFKVDEYKSILNTMEKEREENIKLQSQIQKLEIENQNRKNHLQELQQVPKPLTSLLLDCEYDEGLFKSLEKKIAIHEEQVEHQKRIDAHNEEIRKTKELDKQKIIECQTETDKLYSEIKTLEETRKLLEKDFSSFLIERTTDYIQAKMNQFFQKCYGEYEIHFKQNEKKDSLDFYYSKIGSDELHPAAMTSGYERQLLSMSFRIALGSITHLGLYIFDEIDSDSSSDNSIRLYQNFLEGEKYDQVFIITHNQETIEYLRNNFNVNLIELEK